MEKTHLEKTSALEKKVHELQVQKNIGIIESLRRQSPFTPQPKIIHVSLSPPKAIVNDEQNATAKDNVNIEKELISNSHNDALIQDKQNEIQRAEDDLQMNDLKTPPQQNNKELINPSVDYNSSWISAYVSYYFNLIINCIAEMKKYIHQLFHSKDMALLIK